MARDKKPAYGFIEPQQEEMTVVVVKFKDGAESMQKGFDAVNNAIAALGPTQASNQRVIVHRASAQLAASMQNGHSTDAETDELNPDSKDEDIPHEMTAKVTPTSTPKHQNAYTFMNDFNLSPTGVPSLKDYCTEKNPQSGNDKFLIASAWIQTHGASDPFTGHHLFTAFRAMGWKTQVDMTQPLRRLKSEKSYYENPSTGKWKLTGIGLKAAENIGK